VDYIVDESEILIMNLIADAQNIIKVTKIKPKKVFIYTATEWKWNVYAKILNAIIEGKTNFGEVMKRLIADPSTSKVKQSPDMVKRMIEDVLSDPLDSRHRKAKLSSINESEIFNDARSLLVKEFTAEIAIYNEDESEKIDPKNRAKMARPYKPALYIE
jgi:leucyl-tRNA synthetase